MPFLCAFQAAAHSVLSHGCIITRRFIIAVAIWLEVSAIATAQAPVFPQVEQSRQFTGPPATVDLQGQRNAPQAENFDGASTSDDAFGSQVIFKRQDKPQPFSAFAGIEAFVTNNVALAKVAPQRDGFLEATAGASFTQRFAYNLRFDASLVGAAYRYDRFPQLDFQSTEPSAAVTWSPPQLHGAEVLLRYTFTDLTAAPRVREFYKSQAILLGAQKVIPFSRSQVVYFGASAQWSFAEPQPDGRDEYVAYCGYKAQLTRRLSADLFYRYGRYVYRAGDGRQDNNHTISLGFRYSPTDWFSLSVNGYIAVDRSNQPAFDYDVGNAGLGLEFSFQF